MGFIYIYILLDINVLTQFCLFSLVINFIILLFPLIKSK